MTMPPRALYYKALDTLLVLTEEVMGIAQPIDMFLTLWWHPNEKRPVGFQLMEVQLLFSRLRAVLEFQDSDTIPLYKVVELARMGGLIEAAPDSVDLDEINAFYDTARKLAEGVTISPGSWKQGPNTMQQQMAGDDQRSRLLEQAALILEQEGWLLARMTHEHVGGRRVAQFRDRFEEWQQRVRDFRNHSPGMWPEPPDNS